MKKSLILILLGGLVLACSVSSDFSKEAATSSDTVLIKNPILAGFYPDPSICKVDSSYYLVTSTFAYFPGIPVFKSNDLVNWKQISNVVHRTDQLDYNGLGVSRGIFAPTISYNKGSFYVACTMVDAGGNFIMTAETPEGPWSDPAWIPEIDGIDPSIFFDDDGKTYITYNSIAPDNKPLYEGHRTIRIYELDKEKLKVVGEEHLLVNGGVDISEEPVWVEAPHIYKKNGYYYLIAAEGGTSYQHSEVVFRSKSVFGPYEPYINNPILTQRHLDRNRANPITSTGHADLVTDHNGDWWAIFLGCRPYEENYFNTGRETFLAPVEWIDGWPVINPNHEEVQYKYPKATNYAVPLTDIHPLGGNFNFTYNFNNSESLLHWMMLRTSNENWFDLSSKKGFITLKLRPEELSGDSNPSFISHRQQHINNEAYTSLSFTPKSNNEKAGMAIFQNERHFYFLAKSVKDKKEVVELYKSPDIVEGDMELLASAELSKNFKTEPLLLKVTTNGTNYNFYYSSDENSWLTLKEGVDGTFLSTEVAQGFVGTTYGLYATSLGQKIENTASFDFFKYSGNDPVY